MLYTDFFSLGANCNNYLGINNLSLNNIKFFENYFFDTIYFQNTKKDFYTWTTTGNHKYFFNSRIYQRRVLLSSHNELYQRAYIFWNIHRIANLFYLDSLIKNIFIFLNFSKNKPVFMYDNMQTFWDFIYDEYIRITFF